MPQCLIATLDWIEKHSGLAAYIQAVGAIVIIYATVRIAGRDRLEMIRKEKSGTLGLARMLMTEAIAFEGKLERAIGSRSLEKAKVAAPLIFWRVAEKLYMLDEAGEFFISMLSILGANDSTVDGMLELQKKGMKEGDAWPYLDGQLRLALSACQGGIAALQKLLGIDLDA